MKEKILSFFTKESFESIIFDVKNKIMKYNGWKLYFIPSVFFFFVYGLTNLVIITDFRWSDLDKYEETIKIQMLESELEKIKNLQVPMKAEIENRNTACSQLKEINMNNQKQQIQILFDAINKNGDNIKLTSFENLKYSDKSVAYVEIKTENKFKEVVLLLLLKKAFYLYDYENKKAVLYFKTDCK